MNEAGSKRLVVDGSHCKGCGICVAFCPQNALGLARGKCTLLASDSCTLCGMCEQRCPDYAVFVRQAHDEEALLHG